MKFEVTVNGVALKAVVNEMISAEYRAHKDDEQKSMSALISRSRSHSTSSFRNHSGSRSGKGRVIYSVGGAA